MLTIGKFYMGNDSILLNDLCYLCIVPDLSSEGFDVPCELLFDLGSAIHTFVRTFDIGIHHLRMNI